MRNGVKVLHIETGRHVYGGPHQVLCLLKGLNALGINNVLVCAKGTPFARLVQQEDIACRAVPIAGDVDIPAIWRIRRIIVQEQPDIVHIHSRRGGDTLGALAGHSARFPMVLSRRVDNPESRVALRYKYPLFEHIIAISGKIREILLAYGLDPERVTCVRDAVDFHHFQGPRDDSWRAAYSLGPHHRLIGMMAQFIPRKGHRFLLQAFSHLHARFPKLRIVLFGKGPLKRDIERQANRLGIADKIVFAGFREDMPRLLPSLEVVAHPALREGLGVSLLQASSAGVPVVASNVGGIPEAIIDNVNGLLVPAADPAALASALSRVLGDRELAQRLGAKGPDIMRERFTPEVMVQGNLDVYEAVLKRCRALVDARQTRA